MKTKHYFIIVMLSLFLVSCLDIIKYSPYDGEVDKRHHNSTEAAAINKKMFLESDTFKFALLSDIHDRYDDLSDAIASINRQPDLMFVISCGDITEAGLSQQFEWYVDVIKKSEYPFLNLIGNHDYCSNGSVIFQKIFGPTNFTFISGNYKFILFDNVIWENNNCSPKYEWLKAELADSSYRHIIFAHLPPWGDQMKGLHNIIFCDIVKPENTNLALYGHNHIYVDMEYNCVHSVVSGSISKREYYIISLIGDKSFIRPISY